MDGCRCMNRKFIIFKYGCAVCMCMGNLYVSVREDLDRAFRAAVLRRFGSGRGALSRGAEAAFRMWVESERSKGRG